MTEEVTTTATASDAVVEKTRRNQPDDESTWEKSVRLSNEKRDHFIHTVVEDVIPADSKPTDDGFDEKWGPKLYEEIYTPDVVAAIQALPAWMQVKTEAICVKFPQKARRGHRMGDGKRMFPVPPGSLAVEKLSSGNGYYGASCNGGTYKLPDDHPAVKEWMGMEQQERDWNTKRNELTNQLRSLAHACNTSHQLYRAWPGALKYADECFPYEAPAEPRRGGDSPVAAGELDIGIMMAKTSVKSVPEN